jgi:hypothetical protein
LSDIFQEVDEEVRRERLKQVWDRYANLIIGAALLLFLAVGGWRGYQYWETKKAAEAGAAFEAAMALAEAGKHAEAEAAYAKIVADGSSGYRMLGRFHVAGEQAETDPQAAVKTYDALAADSGIGRVMQDLAALRAGLILVDSASYEELNRRLEPLTAADRVFRSNAREVLALSAWKAGDRTAAQRWIAAVMSDGETPPGMRARMEVLMTLTSAEAKT